MAKIDLLAKINNSNIINRNFLSSSTTPTKKVNSVTELISEVYRILGKTNELKEQISKIMFSELNNIEINIKDLLINNLNSFINCSYNQIIPDSLIDDGLNIELKNLDYKSILKLTPTSYIGSLYYYDINSGINSTDLNTFLWNVIDNNPAKQNWRDLIEIIYYPVDYVNNKTNVFNIKIFGNYRGKYLKDFNKDFIKSLDIYDEKTLLTNLFDSSFGVINSSNKSIEELITEEKINNILKTIINSDDDIATTDSSLYSFSSENYNKQIKESVRKKFKLTNLTGEKQGVNTTTDETKSVITSITKTSNTKEKIDLFNSHLTTIQTSGTTTNMSSEETNKLSKLNVNVINTVLNNLLLVITNELFSPKIMIIYYLNIFSVKGKGEFELNNNNTVIGAIQILKNNIYDIIKGTSSKIIDFFVKNMQKQITKVIVEPTQKKKIAERLTMRKEQLLSLF